MNAAVKSVVDYALGREDCKAGIAHVDKNEAYTQGYSDQYAIEQMASEVTK